jgi:iron(III) transport system permease protein
MKTGIDFIGRGGFWAIVFIQASRCIRFSILKRDRPPCKFSIRPEEAAENLGARPWQAISHHRPAIDPSRLFAGATIVFIWSFTELGTPADVRLPGRHAGAVFNGIRRWRSRDAYALTA